MENTTETKPNEVTPTPDNKADILPFPDEATTTPETPETAPVSHETPKDAETPPKPPKAIETGQNEPVNDGEIKDNGRNPDGTIKPGTVLNPKGKPPGTRHMTTLLKEYLKSSAKTSDGKTITLAEAIVRKVTDKAIRGNDKSIEMIWNHLDGKPKESVDMNIIGEVVSPEAKALADKALDDYFNSLGK